jgi:hypothetical protein
MRVYISIWHYSPYGTWSFQFLNPYTAGRTPWPGDQPVERPLATHRRTQTQSNRTHDPNIQADEDGSCHKSCGCCDLQCVFHHHESFNLHQDLPGLEMAFHKGKCFLIKTAWPAKPGKNILWRRIVVEQRQPGALWLELLTSALRSSRGGGWLTASDRSCPGSIPGETIGVLWFDKVALSVLVLSAFTDSSKRSISSFTVRSL